MADARLDGLRKLHVLSNNFQVEAMAFSRAIDTEVRKGQLAQAYKAHDALREFMSEVQIFLPPKLYLELVTYKNNTCGLLSLDMPIAQKSDPAIKEALENGARINLALRELIYKPPPSLTDLEKGVGQ